MSSQYHKEDEFKELLNNLLQLADGNPWQASILAASAMGMLAAIAQSYPLALQVAYISYNTTTQDLGRETSPVPEEKDEP